MMFKTILNVIEVYEVNLPISLFSPPSLSPRGHYQNSVEVSFLTFFHANNVALETHAYVGLNTSFHINEITLRMLFCSLLFPFQYCAYFHIICLTCFY